MLQLTPFRSRNSLSGFEDFYNLMDDFFAAPARTRAQDSFKLDLKET